MFSAPYIFGTTLRYAGVFLKDIFSEGTLKAIYGFVIGALTYLIGVNDLSIFAALIALVGIEFIIQVLGEMYRAKYGVRFQTTLTALETFSFGTAVQTVTYGLLTSAAHLTDTIVLGNSLLEGMVISFLAISQLIRIVKSSGKMGYTFPTSFIDWLDALKGESLEPKE